MNKQNKVVNEEKISINNLYVYIAEHLLDTWRNAEAISKQEILDMSLKMANEIGEM